MESRLKFFSFGVVTQSKEIGSKNIVVFPEEHLGLATGEINSNVEEIVDEGRNAIGETYSTSVRISDSIRAEWLDLGGKNDELAPDVIVGEKVLLLRYSKSSKIYWTTLGLHSRRLETILKRWSNNRDVSVDKLDDDNSYWYKLSTHEKITIYKTNMNDGEVAWYQIALDGKDGVFSVIDNEDNQFYIDTPNTIIEMINKDLTKVRLEKKTASIFAADSIDIKTARLTIEATEEIRTESPKHIENIKSITTTGDTLTVNMKDVKYDANNFSLTATFDVAGDTSIKGSTSIKGDFSAKDGDFTHDGVDVGKDHIHDGGTVQGKTLKPVVT